MTRTEHVALKGTREGLVLYLDPQAEFTILIDEMQKLLKGSAQFLKGASVRCYGGEKIYTDSEQKDLARVLSSFDLELVGWLKTEEVYVPGKSVSNPVKEKDEVLKTSEEGMTEGNCLFIERTLRSGKSIQFDGHVVIIGDLNPGAEIVATGNIVVLGSIRGVAHAGATGNREAIVYALHLAPTQLRIADLVTRAPEESESRGPEIAKIRDNQLVVEGLSINGVKKLLY